MTKRISLHPKLASFLDLVFSVILLWSMPRVNNWLMVGVWLACRLVLWVALMWLVYYPESISRLRHFFSLLIFSLGMTSFFLFIEWQWSWYVLGIAFVFFPAVSFWLVPPTNSTLIYVFKPFRRWKMTLSMVGLFGLWSGLSAIISFQILYTVSNLVWFLLGAVVSALMNIWWWREYSLEFNRKFLIWTFISALLMFELVWVTYWWPLGYLAQGFLLTWLWYVFWLIVRFHLTKDDISWKKQRGFLISNALLLVVYLLLVVRWK